MPRLKVGDVKPGMVLCEDVTKDGRNILLHTGQVIDDRLIKMLIDREVPEILVEEARAKTPLEEAPVAAPVEKVEKPAGDHMPVIKAYIAHDQMSAFISILPQSANDANITADHIKKALVDKGVAFGFVETEIQNAIRRFNNYRQKMENLQVARGKLAQPGKQGDMEVVVPHFSSKEEFQKISSVKYASELRGVIKDGTRVDPGTVIAKRLEPTPSIAGTDVCGETVDSQELTKVPVNLGEGVETVKEDTRFQATATGVVIFLDGILSVFPMNFDGKAELAVSEDKMQARITLYPPAERGNPVKVEDVYKLLTDNRVSYGVVDQEIRGVVHDAAVGNVVENMVIAQGVPPQPGEDGRVEFLFDITGKTRPQTKEDGTVDYKNIKLVESAVEGQELARLVPPGEGKSGFNIYGEETKSSGGKAAQLPTGVNTSAKPGEPNILVATKSGNVHYNGRVVDVQEGYSVKGDVDFSTGNIKYAQSVVIKGDVKSGFVVEAGGDVEVGGTVEDAVVISEGNVMVKCGFIGSGKGQIHAKGNVNVAFVRNQEIRSRNDILVAREAISAKLWAKNTIEALGKPFSIAGGHISARNEIKAYAIGNETGTRTEVEVGRDFTLVDEQQKTDDKIKELNLSRQKVTENLQKLRHIKQLKKTLQPKEEFLLKKLEVMDEKINTQLSSLEKRKQIITQKLLEVGKARIVVEHAVYPGTVIKIGERHMVVTKEIIGPKSIIYVKGEIKAV